MKLDNKTLLIMFSVTILGTILRLIFIDKPDGLWNDEYVSWAIASIPFGKKFFEEMMAQCHMPLYYFYLKFFIHFFGNNDTILRLTSVLPGVIAIPAMYFVGKELKDEKLGLLSASIIAISSFAIYYSQEVRFYELLLLFSALNILFTLKLLKNQSKMNIFNYSLTGLLIILTHTIGFLFVIFNTIFISIYFLKRGLYKKEILISWGVFTIFLAIISTLLFDIFTTHPLSQWWSHFNVAKIGFLFTDYFSPMLTNLVNAPDKFLGNISIKILIFKILPTILAIAGIIKALSTKKAEICGFFYVSLAFILVLIFTAISGKLIFITKYSIEIYPILILLTAFGWLKFKQKARVAIIFIFCFINLFYILASQNSAPKLHRPEGHKIVAELIKNANLKKGDYIILNYYPKDRFEKYYNFQSFKTISINKGNFLEYLGIKNESEFINIKPSNIENKLKNEVINNIKPKQKVSLVILNDVAMYSPIQIQAIKQTEKINKIPFPFLAFSEIKNMTFEYFLTNLRILRIEQKGSWINITFEKS